MEQPWIGTEEAHAALTADEGYAVWLQQMDNEAQAFFDRLQRREDEAEEQRVLDAQREAEADAEAERERAWAERRAAGMGDGGAHYAAPGTLTVAQAHDMAKCAAEQAYIDAFYGPDGPETDDRGLY